MDTAHLLYTAKEAAQLVGVGYSTIRRHVSEGRLKAFRDGRCLWIHASDLACLYPEMNTAHDTAQIPLNSAHDTAQFSADTAQNYAHLTAELDTARRENDILREEHDELRAEIKRLHARMEHLEALNERLTLLLANEQAQRMKVLPSPVRWIRRLFGR